MGSKVGIYPGGPTSGRVDLAPRLGGYTLTTTMRRRQRAAGLRHVGQVEQARRSRQLLWVILAIALAAFTGLRLASTAPTTPFAVGPDQPVVNPSTAP